MVGHLVKKLMEDLEIPIEIDPNTDKYALQVSETQSMDFIKSGDKGYILRACLGRADAGHNMEDLYIEAGLKDLYNPLNPRPITLSIDIEDRGYLTFWREEELGLPDFKEDFEVFLNSLEYWTCHWTGS